MRFNKFFKNYSKSIYDLLNDVDTTKIDEAVELIQKTNKSGSVVYIVGNGGSSSIASHVSVDFTKVAKIKSSTFNNSNLITCFANDYDYENWVKEAINIYCNKGDLIILISSSGTSKNIVNAANYCKTNNVNLITLSGFDKNNVLTQLGNVNFHVDSEEYNFIEMVHNIILVSIVDIFAKKLL
jgi:D-sedoheptulose 7-phosphate isomerase